MRLAFITPPLNKTKFTGGILCILQYANGLAERGHEVYVVPLFPSPQPSWFQPKFTLTTPRKSSLWKNALLAFLKAITLAARKSPQAETGLRSAVGQVAIAIANLLPEELRNAIALINVADVLPEVDVVIATSYETALPAWLSSAPHQWYFLQHYEPYFAAESLNSKLQHHQALASYDLGMTLMVNSSWLQEMMLEQHSLTSSLVLNAIDHATFFPKPRREQSPGPVRIISYGGRNAEWKGFRDLVAAMRIVHDELPSGSIIWSVFGDSLFAPNNNICAFKPLGFLSQQRLADAYRESDILVSASWYESFPLFPLEAMACGCAIVTTAPGTEDYALHGETAEVVPAREPRAIADSIIRVILDSEYRRRLRENGIVKSREFTWERSVVTMENLLLS